MDRKWFGVNRFWGWYPIRFEGWLLTLGMFSSIAATMFAASINSTSTVNSLAKAFPAIATILSITIFVASLTGVKPEFGKKSSKHFSPDNPKAYLYLSFASLPVVFFYIFQKNIVGSSLLIGVFGLLYLTYTNLASRKK